MLDLALIRSEPERVARALARRGAAAEAVDAALQLDQRWVQRDSVREALRHRRRRASEEVARARTDGRDASDLEAAASQVADDLAAIEAEMADLQARRAAALAALPNLPATDTPDEPAEPVDGRAAGAGAEVGRSAARNETMPPWPKPFAPLPHWDLLEMLRLVHKGGGPAGRGFVTWRGAGARLVRALTAFMLDVHTREFGYEEVRAPAVASREALAGSAHLPLLEGKMYAIVGATGPSPLPPANGEACSAGPCAPRIETRGGQAPALRSPSVADLFLAPRAEPHLANLYAGEILEAARLPVRLACAGPAFRREAGGGRGLLRLHQFDTVELYVFATAEQEEEELARAVRAAETILARLGVPHRRTLRPAPALSHAAAKTIDLEVWAPGMPADAGGNDVTSPRREAGVDGGCGGPLAAHPPLTRGASQGASPPAPCGRWLSVAALSTFTDYQARRTHTRYRDAGGRTRFVYTIGGAAVALPHLVAALLENGQEADGSVRLAPVLAPYFGAAEIHG
jgi:seryl-tRNA synthetase